MHSQKRRLWIKTKIGEVSSCFPYFQHKIHWATEEPGKFSKPVQYLQRPLYPPPTSSSFASDKHHVDLPTELLASNSLLFFSYSLEIVPSNSSWEKFWNLKQTPKLQIQILISQKSKLLDPKFITSPPAVFVLSWLSQGTFWLRSLKNPPQLHPRLVGSFQSCIFLWRWSKLVLASLISCEESWNRWGMSLRKQIADPPKPWPK